MRDGLVSFLPIYSFVYQVDIAFDGVLPVTNSLYITFLSNKTLRCLIRYAINSAQPHFFISTVPSLVANTYLYASSKGVSRNVYTSGAGGAESSRTPNTAAQFPRDPPFHVLPVQAAVDSVLRPIHLRPLAPPSCFLQDPPPSRREPLAPVVVKPVV